MRTEHIKYFLNLAQTGSIQQSSYELYTTHQNVSKMIRQLEDELGTELFIRSKKGMELTITGKLLLPVAQRTMNEFAQVRKDIANREKRKEIEGTLHIVGAHLVNFSLIATQIQTFMELYPALSIRLEDKEPLAVLRDIVLHPQSLGISIILKNPEFAHLYEPYMDQVSLTPLVKDTYYCLVHKDSPLADYKSISLHEFVQYPFTTVLSGEPEDCLFNRLITQYGGKISFSSSTMSACTQAVRSGRYVSISSHRGRQKHLNESPISADLRLIPFQEDMRFTISLVTNIHPKLDENSQTFAEFLKNSSIYF